MNIISLAKANEASSISNSRGINPLYPPSPLTAAIGDGVTDDYAVLATILTNYDCLFMPANTTFKITDTLNFEGKTVLGADRLTSKIIQDTLTKPVVYIGGVCHIADLYIGHSSLPSSPLATGLEVGSTVQDGSVIERLYLENNSDGIFNSDSNNYNVFSTTIRDLRITRFNHSGLWLGGLGNTGCYISNVYLVNWDDYNAGTKLSADCGVYLRGYTDGIIGQLNIEHGYYDQGLVTVVCDNLKFNSLHFEGYVANVDYNGMIYVGGGTICFDVITAVFNTFDISNFSDYSFIKIDTDAKIFIKSVLMRNNTKTGSPTLRRFYGASTQIAGAGIYVDFYSSDLFIGSDYFQVNTQGNPVLKKLNNSVYFSQYKGNSPIALATSGTIAVTMTDSEVFTITPGGTCTFNASGGYAGKRCSFIITTSGTTSYTLTWGTNFKTTGTLATGATTSKVFVVNFVCTDGTNWVETGRTVAM
ncbi:MULTISPECIES: hypothetical protein [Dehalobacter]|uniref:Pectate lyase superfamily protein domain-containing protein n=1 Tax=Dehalobacter restrictus (strain DSM 9455 / PER-K23) TaxID=871738 RepID=A0ABN4BWF6_DEHRP|nr:MULTISPECIES: hypothetical protein [Dehalobacter]AHF10361.1 hypothetical protein DEHRE_09955 [Dehalobacter restrictus DSM 9455]MDJ0304931.1 hypothetical protein [Dehalobacter sp.]